MSHNASDPLFNEKAADAEVNKSLHKEIIRLREELKMHKIIKSTDGKYYRGEFEEVSEEEFIKLIDEKRAQLAELQAIAPSKPADPQPDAPTQDQGQPAPAAPVVPVEQPSQPADGQPVAAQPEAPVLQ